MGAVRACISHPFEVMKLKSQINQRQFFYSNLFKGVQYSIASNALERGIQFGLYEKLKINNTNIASSAKAGIISTTISLPYNIFMLRNIVMRTSTAISPKLFATSAGLEYVRNLSGSTLFLYTYNFLKERDVPIVYRAPLTSCVVWGLTYPLDSYKNIRLAHSGGSADAAVKLSVSRLYRGIQYPIARSIPSSIVGFYVYEYVLSHYS
jgi:hypothetical protein